MTLPKNIGWIAATSGHCKEHRSQAGNGRCPICLEMEIDRLRAALKETIEASQAVLMEIALCAMDNAPIGPNHITLIRLRAAISQKALEDKCATS